MKKTNGFTLVELMIVILVVGILAAVAVPMMRGKIDDAKWAEAHSIAGAIRRAERMYFMETGKTIKGRLSNRKKADALGLQPSDLNATYFVAGNFRITRVDSNGIATVQVRGTKRNAPNGRRTLKPNGDWE